MTEHFVRSPASGKLHMPQPIVRRIAVRALQVVIAAVGMLFIFLLFSRQADAAPPSQQAAPSTSVSAVSAVTSAVAPVTPAVTSVPSTAPSAVGSAPRPAPAAPVAPVR